MIYMHSGYRHDGQEAVRSKASDPRVRPAEYRHESGPRVGSGTLGQIRARGPDPRVRPAGLTRRSAENNSRVILARPASDPILAGHDLTRPARFSTPLNPT